MRSLNSDEFSIVGVSADDGIDSELLSYSAASFIAPGEGLLHILAAHPDALLSLWYSDLSGDEAAELCLDQNDTSDYFYRIVFAELPDLWIKRQAVTPFFHKSHKLNFGFEYVRLHGRAMVLTVASSSLVGKEQLRDRRMEFTNRIRLSFGEGAAFSQHLETHLDNGKISRYSEGRVSEEMVGTGGGRSTYRCIFPESRCPPLKVLSLEQNVLMDASFQAEDLYQKFLYAWMAIEATVGSGSSRAAYFTSVDASGQIDMEVRRIHKLRSAIAHGKHYRIVEGDLQSVLWALRLSLVARDREKEFAEHYRQWLSVRRQ